MSVTPMVAGAIIAGRFEVERAASSGGMGTVYRARDLHSGRIVALKLLHPVAASGQDAKRLLIESQLLAELRHRRIVSYIAHGQTPSGHPFLAMEWLDGEDLAQRLNRQPLTLNETFLLIRGAADALAAAHKRGIVHRDIKPSNLFLPDGRAEQVVLLDFGVARQQQRAMSLTRTGALVGTPGYMAPEQARGQRDIGPSADIFSLGCVFLECLTGQPPFVGVHLAALLSKILYEEAPSVSSLRPEVPAVISELVARMLRKDPRQRPRDGTALLAELEGIAASALDHAALAPVPAPVEAPFSAEQNLVCVLMASDGTSPKTRQQTASDASLSVSAEPPHSELGEALQVLGAEIEWLAEHTLVATVTAGSTATDRAVVAARCALRVRELWPEALVALATGRGVMAGSLLVGEVIDRVSQFLDVGLAADGVAAGRGILMDEVTAGLIDASFAIERAGAGLYTLRHEQAATDRPRALIDEPMPFVGRGHEMDLLMASLRECQSESLARAVILNAPPGMGKTRLRQELVRSLRDKGEPITLLCAHGAAAHPDARDELIERALRGLCGIDANDAPDAVRAKLAARLEGRMDGEARAQALASLRWLCRVPLPADTSLLGPRQPAPAPLSPQLVHGFVRWLDAECSAQPVLLIVENGHLADARAVSLLDAAMRELPDRPLMILVLTRPDVSERFPQLWFEYRSAVVPLASLPRSVCERLVRRVLGPEVANATVERLVGRAHGNPLHLEELLRAALAGNHDSLPETLLALVQVQLLGLPPLTRRILRAASLFGLDFSVRGVLELLGNTPPVSAEEVEQSLQLLIEAQLIAPQRESRLAVGVEYRFRQPLIQEAVYTLLTPAARMLGHRLAHAFLTAAGESDQSVLDEHARRGRERTSPS